MGRVVPMAMMVLFLAACTPEAGGKSGSECAGATDPSGNAAVGADTSQRAGVAR